LEETLEKENVVESDTEEVVQEVEDFENEGYFEEENVVENDAEKEAAKCHICGREDESGHHAVVPCTKALALRLEMRNHWRLPDESQFQHAGPGWLPTLLSTMDKETAVNTLLILWCVWYLRNDVMHGKGMAIVHGSMEVLTSYVVLLNITEQAANGDPSSKGKKIIHEGVSA
jgi:hypothetical protein